MNESWSVKKYSGNPLGPFDPEFVEYSVYPFQDLPDIKLHVPYHFVFVNTGRKLFELYGEGEVNFDAHFNFLSDKDQTMMLAMRNIYVAWKKAVPSLRWSSGMDNDNDNDNDKHVPPPEPKSQGEARSDHRRGGRDGRNRDGKQGQDIAAGPSTASMGQRRTAAESLAPWDSASCLQFSDLLDEGDGEGGAKPFVDDEEYEYEDAEFFEGLKQWAIDVWTATHPHCGSDSGVTLIDRDVAPAPCKAVGMATSPTAQLLSVH